MNKENVVCPHNGIYVALANIMLTSEKADNEGHMP